MNRGGRLFATARERRQLRSRHRGRVVVIAGPDGSGKTYVADRLHSRAAERGPVVHLHHRPQVLPGMTRHDGPVTEPHRHEPYPPWLSRFKLVYIYLDYLLGWLLRVRPAVRAGGTVLIERGWWDLRVDPRRYRLTALPTLHSALGWLLPRPDRTIVLEAPVDLLLARKAELPADELERQRAAWRSVPRHAGRLSVHDATASPDELVTLALTIRDRLDGAWIGLPRSTDARWLLPVAPGRAAANGLRIYTPVTPRGLAGWSAMHAIARTGALRVWRRTGPEPWVLDELADLMPPAGRVSIARSTHAGRLLALVMTAAGDPVYMVKLTRDLATRQALAGEARALEDLAPHLTHPLSAPRVHAVGDGRLVLTAIRWRPQLVPWRLDVAVAGALGRFYRSGRRPDGSGFAHGDVAPWNLLSCGEQWCLVDWESARADRPPFYDLFHFVVQSHALLGRPSARHLLEGLRGAGWVGACIRTYAEAAEVQVASAEEGLDRYLRDSLEELDGETEEGRLAGLARGALLGRLNAVAGRAGAQE